MGEGEALYPVGGLVIWSPLTLHFEAAVFLEPSCRKIRPAISSEQTGREHQVLATLYWGPRKAVRTSRRGDKGGKGCIHGRRWHLESG